MKNPMVLLSFRDSWIWALMVVLFVGLPARALYYQYVILGNRASPVQVAVMGGTIAAVLWITFVRYFYRWGWITKWRKAFHINLGMAIMPEDEAAQLRVKLSGGNLLYLAIEKTVIETIAFWEVWTKTNIPSIADKAKSEMEEGIRYATLIITTEPILVRSTQGPLPSKYMKGLLGVQMNKELIVLFDGIKIKDTGDFLRVVKHEVSHLCLQELGISTLDGGEQHHKIFHDAVLGA